MAPNRRFMSGVWLTLSLARFLRVERVAAKAFIPHRFSHAGRRGGVGEELASLAETCITPQAPVLTVPAN